MCFLDFSFATIFIIAIEDFNKTVWAKTVDNLIKTISSDRENQVQV